jgi:ABC-type polysaccharide/polyol phosphate transport system ATPase subunit
MMDGRNDDEILVKVENVSKKFCRNLRKSLWYGVCDIASELMPLGHHPPASEGDSSEDRPLRRDEFWAVKDVSFELRRGECLGLIGHNGAGKTTLLKMLNGLIRPDSGRITMRGRVGALIALGAGFNPILTGRENVYVNASVLGLSKAEIDEKIDEIIDFAEIREFIDTPVQNYSSGMQVRLGFAVATALKPDVLILDEVLAVGDGSFRIKCYRRIDELRSECALIFVSHDIPSISRICNHALILDRGKKIFSGNTIEGVRQYLKEGQSSLNCNKVVTLFSPITELEFANFPTTASFDEEWTGAIKISTRERINRFGIMFHIKDFGDNYVASHMLDASENKNCFLNVGVNHLSIRLSSVPLRPGSYRLCVGITDERGDILATNMNGFEFDVIGGSQSCVATCQLDLSLSNSASQATNVATCDFDPSRSAVPK